MRIMQTPKIIYQKTWCFLGIILLAVTLFFTRSTNFALAQSPHGTDEIELRLATEPTARVLVALHPLNAETVQIAQSQADLLNELSAEDFRLIYQYQTLPGLIGEVTQAGLEHLRRRPEVAAIALDLPVEAAVTPGAILINADRVWQDFGLRGAGVNVAVIDSGIDTTHPDLTGAIIAQHCFNRSSCPPNHTDEGNSAQDENGHGTHVAGIIASRGGSSPQGIAADAGLVAVRVLGQNGSGFTSDVLAGIDWVVANQATLNVKVINLSLGGGSYSGVCDQADATIMLYATAVAHARQAGITLFAASGNNGASEQMMAPACVSGVLSVGSVYATPLGQLNWPNCVDMNIVADQVVCSSNSSSALDLLAPGVTVDSTALGGGQTTKSGTSMATAHASAVAALVLQANPNLSPSELEIILKETGLPITDPRNGRLTPRIDALKAVTRALGDEVMIISGVVQLQGRLDYSRTEIYLSEQPCSPSVAGTPVTTTESDGHFEITLPANHIYQCLQAVQSGYLIGQKPSPEGDLGQIILPGGDVTGDNKIDILDLAFIATYYKTDNPAADINANGWVDILDLVIAAGNYNLDGPVTKGW